MYFHMCMDVPGHQNRMSDLLQPEFQAVGAAQYSFIEAYDASVFYNVAHEVIYLFNKGIFKPLL